MDTKKEVKRLVHGMISNGNKREQLFDYEGNGDDMFFHVDTYVKTRFWYTMGGPNVYVDVTSTRDGSVQSMTAVAAWGGESFETNLSEGDHLWTLIEQELGCLLDAQGF